ncbi:MAG: SAM-dependent methyltransferase, partial [Xanthobacteraceae bacterium]
VQFVGPALRTRMFGGMKQALKAGGLILMQGYRPEQLEYRTGGPDKVENLYTRAILEEAFGDLAVVEISEHDSMVREGTGHNGMSALIDLVAQK